MAKHEAGLGLVSIRDRLSFFGGHMDIDSAPGKGTVVNITVPLAHIVPSSDK
jgi:signal transduction histidine kinase